MSDFKNCGVGVIGAGAFGTAMANVLSEAGHPVKLWSRTPEVVAGVNDTHRNPRYLSDLDVNASVVATGNLEEALAASVVVCAIPTQKIRAVFGPHQALLKDKPLVSTSKGIELESQRRVSEIFAELEPSCRYVALSGPSFAREVMLRVPTAVTVASVNPATSKQVQQLFSTPAFRAYRSDDVVGVEVTGALKNVIALASGMVAGLELGYNTQAALINRGLAEIVRLGTELGAHPRTFLGLAGMGDLMMTCMAPLSRNRTLGGLLAKGMDLAQARDKLGGVAEGYYTAASAEALARASGVEMPISSEVYRILYQGSTPRQALGALMSRDLKHEWE